MLQIGFERTELEIQIMLMWFSSDASAAGGSVSPHFKWYRRTALKALVSIPKLTWQDSSHERSELGKCMSNGSHLLRWIGWVTVGEREERIQGGPDHDHKVWSGTTLLMWIRGNPPSASGPLNFWKITELSQNYKNKPCHYQGCLTTIMMRTANTVWWHALYFHIGDGLTVSQV